MLAITILVLSIAAGITILNRLHLTSNAWTSAAATATLTALVWCVPGAMELTTHTAGFLFLGGLWAFSHIGIRWVHRQPLPTLMGTGFINENGRRGFALAIAV